MSKKHFIALADAMKASKPHDFTLEPCEYQAMRGQWIMQCNQVADVCARFNSAFKRERWFDYINGDCGPNGGAVKK